MTQKRRGPAGQGGTRCNSGEKNTPDNIRLMVIILIMSHPSWMCERRAIAVAEAAIFREAIEAIDDYGNYDDDYDETGGCRIYRCRISAEANAGILRGHLSEMWQSGAPGDRYF